MTIASSIFVYFIIFSTADVGFENFYFSSTQFEYQNEPKKTWRLKKNVVCVLRQQ